MPSGSRRGWILGGGWELVRFASWLNGLGADSSSSGSLSLSSVLPEKQVTRDYVEVPELAKARGGAGRPRQRTPVPSVDTLREGETVLLQWPTFDEEARPVAEQEEKAANRKMQEQMLASLDQLGSRLAKTRRAVGAAR